MAGLPPGIGETERSNNWFETDAPRFNMPTYCFRSSQKKWVTATTGPVYCCPLRTSVRIHPEYGPVYVRHLCSENPATNSGGNFGQFQDP